MDIKNYTTGLAHIGIPTKDIVKTVAFYEGLGFETKHRSINPASGDKVVFLRMQNIIVETYEHNHPSMSYGAIDHIALNVTDIDAVFEEISKGGYKLLDNSVQTLPFWENGVRFFTIEGPNLEKIEFCQIN